MTRPRQAGATRRCSSVGWPSSWPRWSSCGPCAGAGCRPPRKSDRVRSDLAHRPWGRAISCAGSAVAILTIVGIVLLNFVLFRAMPGSPDRISRNPQHDSRGSCRSSARAGVSTSRSSRTSSSATWRRRSRGDFGQSFKYKGQDVTEVIATRVWPTLILFGLGELIAIVGRPGAGCVQRLETRRCRRLRRERRCRLILYSMPYFLLGMILLIVFATALGWFPTSGMFTLGETYSSFADQLLDFLHHLVAAARGGQPRADRPVLDPDALVGHRDPQRGLRHDGQGQGHLGRRASCAPTPCRTRCCPTVSLIAINLGFIIAGAITVEVVFSWPGLGTLTQEALEARDYPVLQAIFLILAVTVVLANLVADIVYGRARPAGADVSVPPALVRPSLAGRPAAAAGRLAGRDSSGDWSAGRRASSGSRSSPSSRSWRSRRRLFVGPLETVITRDRWAAPSRRRRSTCSAPTTSAATSST